MNCSRPVRAIRHALLIGGIGLAGLALLAGCGSSGGDGTATVPTGISAPSGGTTLPSDLAVTAPPPAEDPIEVAPADDPIATAPAEEPIEAAPVEEPAADTAVEEAGGDLTVVATDDDVVWWPWALAIIVLVVAIVAVLASRSRRRSSGWTAKALAMIDASDSLTTHLLALAPEGLVVVARDDVQRLTELDATTQDLVLTAPDDRGRSAINSLRGPLAQLHAAVDMVSLSPVPTAAQLTLVHQSASALHAASSTARSTLTTRSS